MSILRVAVVVATSMSWLSPFALAQCEGIRLGGVPGENFNVPAIDGGALFVGSLGANSGAGAVFGFEQAGSDWSPSHALSGSSGSAFGLSCSLSDDVLLVGSLDPIGGSNNGAAYFFHRAGATWIEVTRVTAPLSITSPTGFGRSVAVDGDAAVVGAPFEGNGGAVYVFERGPSGWARTARLVASDGTQNDRLGIGVDIDGERILATDFNDALYAPSGAAYVFERTGTAWPEVAKLTTSDGTLADYAGAGTGIALAGDRAYVGAHGSSSTVFLGGAVYAFEDGPTGWSEIHRLELPEPATTDVFGFSVAATEGHLLVGAPPRHGGADPGRAYLFSTANWKLEATLQSTDWTDAFGSAVTLSGRHAVVAASLAEFVYVYDLVAASRYCEALPNSTGEPALLHAMGCGRISANEFELVAAPVPAGQPGVFFFGPGETSVPFGDGRRCVSGGAAQIHRLPPTVADPSGDLTLAVDFGAVSSLAPGSTWKFQAWYRDPAAQGAGFNLSDGLSISFQ